MQVSFFDVEDCYARLERLDHLLKLDAVIDWSWLAALMAKISFDSAVGGRGRPPLDGLLMAKILILQACNNLSDEMAEFLINDRFRRGKAGKLTSMRPLLKKGGVSYHGYRNHVSIDAKYKLIRGEDATTASVHDSQKLDDILYDLPENAPAEDKNVFADSAYRSEKIEAELASAGLASQVHERAYRNKPLTPEQKAKNREKSRVRARVEHVFGHMENSMGGMIIHTIGLARAKVKITFKNLAYNMWQFAFLVRQQRQVNCA